MLLSEYLNPQNYFINANGDKIFQLGNGGYKTVYASGRIEFALHNYYHRLDGPAVELPEGTKHWYKNGTVHRLNGPAIENANGYKEWRVNGDLHRLDGPAIEWPDGEKRWYINDTRYYTEFEYWIAVQKYVDTY